MNGSELIVYADPEIRDDDLRAKLEASRGKPAFDIMRRMLLQEQEHRDALVLMTPVQRRRAETRELLLSQTLQDEDRHHIHSVLALCGLPYREPKEGKRDVFVKHYGKNTLMVQAGYLEDPMTGEMVHQGLPYGPKARLLLLHLCTMAIRQKSPTIEVADSLSAFIRDVGYPVTGGKRGTLTQFKEQLNRLAASRLQIGMWHGDRHTTIKTQAISSFDMWLPNNPNQRMLWSSTLTMDQRFFDTLQKHALPVDIRSLRAFSQSARQMDIVLWLGSRLKGLDRKYTISWTLLHEQFGFELARLRRFREEFRDDLAVIREVFPKLDVDLDERGLTLKPCPPEELFVAPKRSVIKGIRSGSSS